MVNSANIQRTCEKTKQRRRFIAVTHKYNRLNTLTAEGIKPKMTIEENAEGRSRNSITSLKERSAETEAHRASECVYAAHIQ